VRTPKPSAHKPANTNDAVTSNHGEPALQTEKHTLSPEPLPHGRTSSPHGHYHGVQRGTSGASSHGTVKPGAPKPAAPKPGTQKPTAPKPGTLAGGKKKKKKKGLSSTSILIIIIICLLIAIVAAISLMSSIGNTESTPFIVEHIQSQKLLLYLRQVVL